jgi:hypothetical protein
MSGLILGGTSLAIAAIGTGVSLYGSSQSAAAASSAAARAAMLARYQANATAAVQRFQAQLNYRTALAQSQVYKNNAVVLHDQARSTEKQGSESVTRMIGQDAADQSATQASYGASGVTSDTGSPVVVSAYNAGMAQLARMDAAYKTNLEAGSYDWEARMQTYQSKLTLETAKQFQYAEAMANWTEKTGIIASNATQMAGNNMANAQLVAGLGNSMSNFSAGFGNAVSTYAAFRQPTANTPTTATNPAVTPPVAMVPTR